MEVLIRILMHYKYFFANGWKQQSKKIQNIEFIHHC